MATPHKKIGFDDIRVGDTIRVVDVRDLKIAEAGHGFEVRGENGVAVLRESRFGGGRRTFQLLDRVHESIPTKKGSVIEVNGERFVLVQDTYAPTDMWVTTLGGHKLEPERVQMIADHALGFEVIA